MRVWGEQINSRLYTFDIKRPRVLTRVLLFWHLSPVGNEQGKWKASSLISQRMLLRKALTKSGKVKVLVAQSCLTLWPVDCGPPGSSVHGILQARILEWVAIPSPEDLPDPGMEPRSPTLQADSLPSELPVKPQAGQGNQRYWGQPSLRPLKPKVTSRTNEVVHLRGPVTVYNRLHW